MSSLPKKSHGRQEGKGSVAEAVSSARKEDLAGTLQNM